MLDQVRLEIDQNLDEESKLMAFEVRSRFAISDSRFKNAEKLFRSAYGKLTNGDREFPVLTPASLKSIIIRIGVARSKERGWPSVFSVDSMNSDVFNTLCFYFANDSFFETIQPGFSLKKGIMLIGAVGCGKSELMHLFHENPKLSFTKHQCQEIVSKYSSKAVGEDIFSIMSSGSMNSKKDSFFGHRVMGRVFHDIGSETLGNHMGNTRNVMAEIIKLRYDYTNKFATHYTTNYTIEQLMERYDEPTMNRLISSCNVLYYPTEAVSRR